MLDAYAFEMTALTHMHIVVYILTDNVWPTISERNDGKNAPNNNQPTLRFYITEYAHTHNKLADDFEIVFPVTTTNIPPTAVGDGEELRSGRRLRI